MQVLFDGIALDLAPDIRTRSETGVRLLPTVSGGALLWQGRLRQHITLKGQGLTRIELERLESAASEAAPVELRLGDDTWQIVLTAVRRNPTTGSDRWSIDAEGVVVATLAP